MSSNLKEFIVTLHKHEDLDNFYDDMETPGGNLFVPDRAVGLVNRRPTSRNTHYMLTDEEAATLRNDPRVMGVDLVEFLLLGIKPMFTQTGVFDKSDTLDSNHINWALLRCTEGEQRENWGVDGTASQSATARLDTDGRHVDVVIIDGHINPDHPEYAVNPDGTGGSRVVQLNWHTLTAAALGLDDDSQSGLTGNYVYTPYYDATSVARTGDNNHGAHVAGTACGSKMGWAKKANIYNISPYGTNPTGVSALIMWDYIRAFHRTKPVNPITRRRNPTVCNASYGSEYYFPYNYGSVSTGPITYINNRGVTKYNASGLSAEEITAGGIRIESSGIARVPYYAVSMAADIQDAMNEGIIVVGASGNSYSKVDNEGGPDYNNVMNATYSGTNYAWAIHRGTAPSAVPGVICVGAIDSSTAEYKGAYSNCGPRIDIYAPGNAINSSVNSNTTHGGVIDSRNNSYYLTKMSGTSMATPQVTGVVACILSKYPRMNQENVRNYLIHYSKKDQMGDTGLGQESVISLQGAPNRYLFIPRERKNTGTVFPKNNHNIRPTSGVAYPRRNITRQ